MISCGVSNDSYLAICIIGDAPLTEIRYFWMVERKSSGSKRGIITTGTRLRAPKKSTTTTLLGATY